MLVALILASALAGIAAPSTSATVHVIDINAAQGKPFEGWGVSLAWWAHAYGNSADAPMLADLAFTTQTQSLGGQQVPGLGLNIVRYNIGASSAATGTDNRTTRSAPAMAPARDIPAWCNGVLSSTQELRWSWDADPAQRRMLQLAMARGVDCVECFSNSPPDWMCKNGSAAGSVDGGDNLLPGHVHDFARYLAWVATHLNIQCAGRVHYLEPFNEPSASWWKYPKRQEGCHFSIALQKQVLAAVALELGTSSSIRIAASDENDVGTTIKTWKQLGDAQQDVAKINTHGYYGLDPYRGKARSQLRSAAAGRDLWMSEYGDRDATGISLAKSLLLDLNELQPSAWIYWQVVDGGAWGLLSGRYLPVDQLQVNPKWYTLAHFTRHLTPGCLLLHSDGNYVAAWRPGDKKLVIVSLCEKADEEVRFHLLSGRFMGEALAWRSILSADQCQRHVPIAVTVDGEQDLRMAGQAGSLTTIELAVRP